MCSSFLICSSALSLLLLLLLSNYVSQVQGKPLATTQFRIKHTVADIVFQTLKKTIKNQDQGQLNFLNGLARVGREEPAKIVTILNERAFNSLHEPVPFKVCRSQTCNGGIFFEIDQDLPAVSLYSKGAQVTKVTFCEKARLLVSKLKFSPDGRVFAKNHQPVHHVEGVSCRSPEQAFYIPHRNQNPKISVVSALPAM